MGVIILTIIILFKLHIDVVLSIIELKWRSNILDLNKFQVTMYFEGYMNED